jgi:energy-coupling factor transporter ATP-binding protein EcfA2
MTPEEKIAVSIKNLSYTYPNAKQALANVSLEIRKGEYLAIMGANGAGKTTTCLFLNGVIPQITGGRVRGTIHVMGLDTFEHPVYEIAQLVGMVLQDPEAQIFASNIRSEVAFAAENLGVPHDAMVEQVNWALKTVRLDGMDDRTPAQLSGGQKQRLAIASGLVVQPSLLVLDEPTSQLDPLGTDEVFSVLRDLNRDIGLTIVLATHKAEQVAEYADRVIVLENGRLVAEGHPSEVFSQVDLLEKVDVPVPHVTKICRNLQKKAPSVPNSISLDSGKAILKDLLSTNKLSVSKSTIFRPEGEHTCDKEIEPEPCIDVQNVSYTYPGTDLKALDKVNLSVYPGQFIGVIGQNGAGKSTLMKTLLGLLSPSEGTIFLDGKDIADNTPAKVARRVGLVLQNPDTQLFALSAWEEVAFGPQNCGVEENEVIRRVDQALDAVGLLDKRDEYPFNFSFGDRRKISVAAVAAMQPDVLIFDEPTTGQDHKGRYELANIAKTLNQQGTTVIMITHDMGLIAEYTQRLVVMGNGRILLDCPTRNAFHRTDILTQAFITPPQVTQLAIALSDFGFPPEVLTVEEFCSLLQPTIKMSVTSQ